jgi:phenylacetate-CoA ligase
MVEQGKYWDPQIEVAPLSQIKEIQRERLKARVKRAYEKSVYYRKRFDEVGIKPEDISSVEDLGKIPFTAYTAELPADEFLGIPLDEAEFIMSTGATTGSPKMLYLSRKDMDFWMKTIERLPVLWGLGKGDVLHCGFPWPMPFDGFTVRGVRYLPFYHTFFLMDNEIRMMERAKVTVFFGGPAQSLNLFRRAREMGIDLGKAGLRTVLLTGETWSESYRRKIEGELGVTFYDYYASMDIGPTAAECPERSGLHVFEDLVVLEIIDPDTGEVLPPGELGEVVITSLWREAMPFLRYRTGDVAMYLEYEKCRCGRTFPRISRSKGRTAHLLRVKEAKVFPIDVEEAIHSLPELSGEYQIIVDKPGILDRLKVKMECGSGISPSPELEAKVKKELERSTKASCEARLLSYGDLSRGAGFKALRIVKEYE